MNSPGDGQLGGLVFGFTIASLILWLGVGTLPFATPVAKWFRARMLAARGMPPLGREAAAANMSPGQVVLASVAAIVIGSLILWNSGVKIIGELSASAASAFPLLASVFLGAAGLVCGVVFVARGAARRSDNYRRWVTVGVALVLFGLCSLVIGAVLLLGAG